MVGAVCHRIDNKSSTKLWFHKFTSRGIHYKQAVSFFLLDYGSMNSLRGGIPWLPQKHVAQFYYRIYFIHYIEKIYHCLFRRSLNRACYCFSKEKAEMHRRNFFFFVVSSLSSLVEGGKGKRISPLFATYQAG